MKKNKKIVIAIIVVAVLILVVGIALAVVLKNNNKEEFFKYVAQIFDSENGFIDKRIENYNEKKASNTFENIGKMTFNVPTEGMDTKTANEINNTFNISFMGNFDNENQKAEELIKINYDNENNFPILYKKVGNKQAIKMSSILKKYLGMENFDPIKSYLQLYSGGVQLANQANNAKKMSTMRSAKDAVHVIQHEIQINAYDKVYVKEEDKGLDIEQILKEELSKADFQANGVTITYTESNEGIGVIKIVLDEDNSYYSIGNIDSKGNLKWQDNYGTGQSTDEDLDDDGLDKKSADNDISASDTKQLIEKSIQSIKEVIDDNSITKVTTNDSEGFSINISSEKLKEIIDIIIGNLKSEEELLNKYNLNENMLDLIKNSLAQYSTSNGNTTITVYQSNKKVNRIIIELDSTIKIDIKKLEQNDELSYDISLTLSQTNNNIFAKAVVGFTGLDSLETVNENYNIGIDMNGYSYTYNIENEVNFTDVEIKDFADKEYTDINKLSQANQAKLIQAIMDRFNKINNELMQKVKIDPENFWYNLVPKYYAPKIDADEFDYSLDLEDKDDENEDDEDEASQTSDTTDSTETTKKTATDSNSTSTDNDSDENLAKSFSETEKNVFNSKYEKYKGDEVEGSKVKQLIMSIIANNMADEERQIKVTGDVTLTGNEVPDSLETSKTYLVEFKKSKDGYVNEAVIKVNE